MASRYKTEHQEMTIADAISAGYADLQGLRDEMTEMRDNMEEKFSQTARFQTISDTCDTMDQFVDDEPDIPDFLGEMKCTVGLSTLTGKKRGSESRATRCSNGAAYFDAAKGAVEEFLSTQDEPNNDASDDDKKKHESQRDDAEELVNHLDEAIDNANGCEFPGMFG